MMPPSNSGTGVEKRLPSAGTWVLEGVEYRRNLDLSQVTEITFLEAVPRLLCSPLGQILWSVGGFKVLFELEALECLSRWLATPNVA